MGNSISQITYIFSNILSIYIIFRFIECIYESKIFIGDKRWVKYLIMSVYYLTSTIVHLIFANPFINTLVGITLMFTVSLMYKSSIHGRILKTLFLYFLLIIEDYVVFKMCSILNLQNTKYWASFVNIAILLLLLFILKRSRRILRKQDVIDKNDFKLIFIMLISIFLMVYLGMHINELTLSIIIVLFFLIILNAVVMNIYEDLEHTFISKREYLNIRNSMDKYMEQIEKEKQTVVELKKIYHDIKNHLITVNSYIEKNELKKAMEHINEILPKLNYKKSVVYCKDELIDGMLNYKVKEAENKNIKVDIAVNIDTEIKIDSFDMTIILGNLLDNAIEGAMETDKKIIDIKLFTDRGLCFVEIKNSYKTIIKIDKDNYKTTKDDEEAHGLGMVNVRKMVEKNGGYFKVEQTDDLFVVKLFVYNKRT